MDAPKKSLDQERGQQGTATSDSSGVTAPFGAGRAIGSAAGSWTAAATAPSVGILQPSTVLAGRYEILENIGAGGMGEVYRVHDHDLDQIIALKVVKSELSSHSESLQRFKQELLLARRISHRNIVRIFDMREAAGLKFITMEYLEGRTLTAILAERKKLPPSEAIEIVSQLCSGLAAAHAEGVIHRDLKPSNIMRDSQGRVVIMDFGLARTLQGSGMTQTGAIAGTAAYMAPEQAMAKPVDSRTDLYSVGLILYELLTGQQLFRAESAVVHLVRRLNEPATPVRDLDSTISPELNAIVAKCLEREPRDRYQSVADLLAALEALEDARVPRTASQTLATGISAPRLNALSGVVACLVLVLLAALGEYAYRHWISSGLVQHAPVTILVSDFQNNTSDPVFSGTLEPAFSLAMEGAPFITSYNSGTAHKLAAQLHPGATQIDASLARLIATREGINATISGSISRKGSSYLVAAQAEDALTGKHLGTEQVTADRSNVLVAMGELAAHIRKDLGDATPISVQMAAAETFTTSSLEAAHEYALGQDAQWAGNYAQGIVHYQNSLRADPDLGRAYSGLAVMAYSLGHQQDALNYYKLALSKIDRMSEREKYRTRGTYYTVIRDTDRAIEEFKQLLQRYPSDNAGHANLALAYFYRRDMEHAMDEARRAVEISPKNVHQRNNVGLFAMYAGDFDTAIREQRTVLEMNPSLVKAYLGIALSQAAQGHLPEAHQTYEALEKVGSEGASVASAGLADLALYQGDTAQARSSLNPAIQWDIRSKDADAAAVKYSMLASAELMSRNSDKAILAANEAEKNSQDGGILFLSARVYLQSKSAKDQARARQIAKILAARSDDDSHAYSNLISGEELLGHGKSQEAVGIFKDALKQADAWLVRFDLGRAYLQAGEFAEADSELELCLKRRGEATAAFLDEVPTIRLLPEVYYYLGRAQEGLNSPAAAESYKAFLAMKNKATNDPLVEDARARVRQ